MLMHFTKGPNSIQPKKTKIYFRLKVTCSRCLDLYPTLLAYLEDELFILSAANGFTHNISAYLTAKGINKYT